MRHVACVNPTASSRADWKRTIATWGTTKGAWWRRRSLLRVAASDTKSSSSGGPKSGLVHLASAVLAARHHAGEAVRAVAVVTRNKALVDALKNVLGDIPLAVLDDPAPGERPRPRPAA